jgi:hypothetical protein
MNFQGIPHPDGENSQNPADRGKSAPADRLGTVKIAGARKAALDTTQEYRT